MDSFSEVVECMLIRRGGLSTHLNHWVGFSRIASMLLGQALGGRFKEDWFQALPRFIAQSAFLVGKETGEASYRRRSGESWELGDENSEGIRIRFMESTIVAFGIEWTSQALDRR